MKRRCLLEARLASPLGHVTLTLPDGLQIRAVPGRRTDVNDSTQPTLSVQEAIAAEAEKTARGLPLDSAFRAGHRRPL